MTEATGVRIAAYGAMYLAAFRCREAQARALIDAMIEIADASNRGTWSQMATWLKAVLCTGLARDEEVLTAARQAAD
jgi:hypothetical protein